MPDEIPAEKPKRTRKRAPVAVDPQARLAELKEKYRLNDIVKINAKGNDGKPLGRGPLLDETVFNKLAELDTTPEKKYLDWMLFQCGGGPQAVTASLTTWGENTPPLDPVQVLQRWKNQAQRGPRIDKEDVEYIGSQMDIAHLLKPLTAKLINAASENYEEKDKLKAIVQVLQENQVAPGKEEKVAVALLSYRVKMFVRNQNDIKARDRIHTTLTYAQMVLGRPLEAFEKEWQGGLMMRKKREYCFADEDSVKWGWFAFSRHWPGKEGKYEKVYNEMKQFLINKGRVEERMAKLDQWNALIVAKNKETGLDIPLREPIDVNLDIGTVILTKNLELKYEGDYPKVSDLATVNAAIEELPMRERIRSDVRYAGPKGKVGRTEKVYSDQNLDLLVPLTVAASIKAGHPNWAMSKPEQLNDLNTRGGWNSSAWSQAHSSRNSTGAVTLFFILKQPEVPDPYKKLRMTVPFEKLTDERMTELIGNSAEWVTSAPGEDTISFKTLAAGLRQAVPPLVFSSLMRSMTKALRHVREVWGNEFDPRHLVPDFLAHHKERTATRRGLREHLVFRAHQIVDQLINA